MIFIHSKSKIWAYILPITLTIFSCIVYSPWVFTNWTVTSGDWLYFFREQATEFFSIPYIWRNDGLGETQATPSFYPFLFIIGLLSKLGLSSEISVRIVFLYIIAIGGVLIPYFSFKKLFNNIYSGFFATLIYSFNTYFLVLNTGHLTVALAYMFLPLIFYLYKITLETKSKILLLSTSLVLFLQSFYEFRITYITLIILVLYLFSVLIKSKDKFRIIIYGLTPFILLCLYNAYWLYDYVISGGPGIIASNVFDRGLFGLEYVKLSHLIFLHHPFFSFSGIHPFIIYSVPLYLYILTILIIFGYFKYLHRNNLGLFFVSILILGLFLSKSGNNPFGEVYTFFYENIPGFNAFRESSKFMVMIAFAYASLVGLLFVKSTSKFKYILATIIIISTLFNVKIFVTKEVGSLFVERHINNEYLFLKEKISSDKSFYRTLWIPTTSRWSYHDNAHPKLSLISSNITGEYKSDFVSFVKSPNFIETLRELGVKYIIIPIDDVNNSDDLFKPYGVTQQQISKLLDIQQNLKQIETPNAELKIYELSSINPLFYADQNIELTYKSVNPTLYHVSITNSQKLPNDLNLYFNQQFHPGWIILPNHLSEQEIIANNIKNTQKINSNQHNLTTSFKLYNSNIKKYTVFFAPQIYYYYGTIISFVSLLFSGIVLLLLLSKYLIKKSR